MDTPEITPEDALKARGIDAATGFATDGKWPVNGRLRAEAMAAAGETTDPDGIVSDELIAATKDRVEREVAEEERQRAQVETNAPSLKWTKDELTAEAARRGALVETDANKAAILAAIEAAPAAPQTEA